MTPTRIRRLPLVAVSAALALTAAACGGSSSDTASTSGSSTAPSSASSGGAASGGVTLAFMGALTGPAAQLGINIKNGAKLAIDEYNASSPSTPITLKDYDTQGDPTQATNVAPTVLKDQVVGVIGPAFSGESKTADPILDQGGIPNISASATNPLLSQNGWKTFHRVLANDDVQGPGVGDFMVKTLAAKNVAVIDDQSEYGKGLADVVATTVKKDGAQIAVRDVIDPKSDDYSATVNKVKAAAPDAVFYGGYYAEAAKFLKQLRDSNVTAKFVTGDGALDQKLVEGAGQAAEGAFVSCTCVLATSSSDARVQKFITNYKKAYNSDPATYSAEGYDVATAYIMAIKAGKTTPADINTYLATEDFQGVSKHIKWEPDGELAGGTTFMHEVKSGTILALGEYTNAQPK